jgi:hypothetical protein
MHVIRTIYPYQGHPVPQHAHMPVGPFPRELFAQGPINYDYEQAYAEDGENFEPGATAQNNFIPLKWYRCYDCHERVREDELDDHECEEE